jgi:hypothetical protein
MVENQKNNILIAIMELIDSVEFTPIIRYSGIGSYEFWGSVEYDKGQPYVDEIVWDESLYSSNENQIIHDYVSDNFQELAKKLY